MSQRSELRRARRWANAELIDLWVPAFNAEYPDEESILRALRTVQFNGEQRCKFCNEILPHEYTRSVKCPSCKRVNWLTAETFFRDVRQIKAWWGTVWLMAQAGVVLTANQVKELFGVALSTAQNILANIAFRVSRNQVGDASAEDLSSSFLRAIYARRSIKTPADEHPEREQDEIEKYCSTTERVGPINQRTDTTELSAGLGDNDAPRDYCLDYSEKPDLSPTIAQSDDQRHAEPTVEYQQAGISGVSTDEDVLIQKLSTDELSLEELLNMTQLPLARLLAAITMAELNGAIKVLPGNRFARSRARVHSTTITPLSESMSAIVASFIEFTKTHWHGIARKNVQLYLSMYWYYQSRAVLGPQWLIQQLCGERRLRRQELVAFVSPLILKITGTTDTKDLPVCRAESPTPAPS